MADLGELQVLQYPEALTELYEALGIGEVTPNPLYDFYVGGRPVGQYGVDDVTLIKLNRTEDPAPINLRGQPARVLGPIGKGQARLNMLNVFNVLKLEVDTLRGIRNPADASLQVKGRQEIEYQLANFAARHVLLKHVYVAKSLTGGMVYFDGNGDVLESSSGSVIQVPTGIPSRNQGQVTRANLGGGSGDVFDLPWDNPAALILTQLDELNRRHEQINNGRPLRVIWMGDHGRAWLRANEEVASHFSSTDELYAATAGEAFRVDKYEFRFINRTYEAVDGTRQPYIPETKALITPQPTDGNWIIVGEGSQYVPNSIDVAKPLTVDQAIAMWEEVYGDFAYLVADHNPLGLNMFMGFNMLFGFRNANEVFPVTVDF